MKRILILLMVLCCAAPLLGQQKISAMISGNPPQNADLIPIARSGANYSLTIAAIIAEAVAAGNPLTTAGDLYYENGTPAAARLPIGSSAQVLTVVAGFPSWQNSSSGFSNPMTTAGDTIYENGTPTPARLAIGSTAQVMTVVGGYPAWANASSGFANPMTTAGDLLYENGTPAPGRLAIGSTNYVLTVVGGFPAWVAAATCSSCTIDVASGSKAMGTSAIASGVCASVVTQSASGVLTTDVIKAGFNGDPTGITGYIPSTNGTLTIFVYPTANNVNFKVCNMTAASVTPGAITLNWTDQR